MPKKNTPTLQQLTQDDSDLVDRIFEYLLAEFPQIAGPQFEGAKSAVREEFRGEDVYIAARPMTERRRLAQDILALFNGRNASEVARRLQCSRATVYRAIKQAGGDKKQSQVSGT